MNAAGGIFCLLEDGVGRYIAFACMAYEDIVWGYQVGERSSNLPAIIA